MIWKVTLNGTLADFDEAAQAAAKAALVVTFNQPSITAEHITLTVEAGSIIVTGEVRLEDPSVDFTALSTTVTALFNNATAATAAFGVPLISVDTLPTLSYASKPPAAPPPPSPPSASPTPPALPPSEEGSGNSSDDDDMLPYIIGGAAGGGCLVLALLVFLCVFCLRKRHKKAVQPLANTDANANSPAAAASASVPTARRGKSKKAAQPPAAEAAQTIYQQNAANPAAGLTQGEFAAADSQLRGGAAAQESETARCLATMAAASGGAGATPFSAQVEAPLAPLAPLQGPAGGAGAGGGGLRPLAPPLTPLGGAAAGGAPGLRPLAPLGSVGGAGGGGRGLAPLRPLGS